ncbi:hypothetical protein L218DRAFT_1005590 [Marasmius fiardii PR-910]|nr:hypothetical protein L218DRAFT_1005590 [Marasmius fiardii PR-910]
MNHSRTYSYEEQATPYSSVDVTSQSSYSYSTGYPRYDQEGPAQQYYLPSPASNPHGHSIDARYRSSTPTAHHRYSRAGADPRYSPPSELLPSNSTSNGYYNSSQYPASQSGDRFIPTPSELAHSYYSNQQPPSLLQSCANDRAS